MGVVAVVTGIVLGAVAVIALRSDESSAAAAVTLVPAVESGDDPFSESVQTTEMPAIAAPAADAASASRADLPRDDAASVLVATGTEPGLYGGSGDAHVCDAARLVAYLGEHPDKAAAWSSVLGTTPDAIEGYVATLTPVVLLSDTIVTNHGFRDGTATELTSVLQAGTAVMVDAQGVPRVKCNCGNPLTPPQVVPRADWHVDGAAWEGYDAADVTGVTGGDTVTELTLRDVVTGETYVVPVGSGTGASPDVDGDWTLELRTAGGLSPLPPGSLDPDICPTAGLDGAVLSVRGRQASLTGASGFGGDLTGTAAAPPLALPAGMSGVEVRLHPVGADAPEVMIKLASTSSDRMMGDVSMTSAQDPGTRVSQCDAGVVARRAATSTPAPTTPSTAPPTTRAPVAPAADLRGTDWANRTYRLGDDCSGPDVTLRGGTFEDAQGYFGVRLVGVTYGDLTGDGQEEALVRLECYPIGGNAYPATPNLVFTATASGVDQLGQTFEGNDATIVGDAVRTTESIWGPNDPRCCPSSTATHTWRYRNGAWVE